MEIILSSILSILTFIAVEHRRVSLLTSHQPKKIGSDQVDLENIKKKSNRAMTLTMLNSLETVTETGVGY